MGTMTIAKTAIREKRAQVGRRAEGVLLTWDEAGGRGGGHLHRCLKRICE